MESYLLKASAILAIFLFLYQIFLKEETFFKLNRFFLLSGLVAALLLPFVTIQEEILIQATPINTFRGPDQVPVPEPNGFEWTTTLIWAYILGIVFFTTRVLKQLLGLFSMIRKGRTIDHEGYVLIPSRYSKGPFSFFRYIFYNPEAHGEKELQLILEHEKAHGRQLHSLDILLARLTSIVLWLNPLAWWYQKIIQQNLEYLADSQAVSDLPSIREYQYALLKVSGNELTPALVSPFNQSLIKKRIVMLQRNQSKSIHLAKYLLILPMLALFLMAFNRETVYVTQQDSVQELMVSDAKIIEVTIDKETTDEELVELKEKLTKDGVDFSYTTVRNDAREIINLSFSISGKSENGNPFSGSYNSDSDEPIKPVMIYINSEGSVFFGEASTFKKFSTGKEVHFTTGSGDKMIWVKRSGEENGHLVGTHMDKEKHVYIVNGKEVSTQEVEKVYLKQLEERENMIILEVEEDAQTIEVREKDGKKIVIVDGKEVSEDELHEVSEHKNIFVKVLDEEGDSDSNIFTIDMDEDDDSGSTMIWHSDDGSASMHKKIIINSEKSGDYDTQMKVISTDGKKPLIYIDGKKANEKEMKKINPDQIETINVYKGEKAMEKFGKKAKDGVIEITTKKG